MTNLTKKKWLDQPPIIEPKVMRHYKKLIISRCSPGNIYIYEVVTEDWFQPIYTCHTPLER